MKHNPNYADKEDYSLRSCYYRRKYSIWRASRKPDMITLNSLTTSTAEEYIIHCLLLMLYRSILHLCN